MTRAPGKKPNSPSEAQHRARPGLLAPLSPDRGGVGALACRTNSAAAATFPRPTIYDSVLSGLERPEHSMRVAESSTLMLVTKRPMS